MSLKAFHIFFIVVCTLFFVGFSAWMIIHESPILMVAVGITMSIALLVYLPWFIRHHRKTT